MDVVSVRYIVDDVAASTEFYTRHLGFMVEIDAAPAFAALARGIQLPLADLAGDVERLRAAGLRFRNDVVVGRGGSQILLEDPAGNLVELFQPAA